MNQGKTFKIAFLRKVSEYVVHNYSYRIICSSLNISKSSVQKIKRKLLNALIDSPEKLFNTSNQSLLNVIYGDHALLVPSRKSFKVKISRRFSSSPKLIPDFKRLAVKYISETFLNKKDLYIEYKAQAIKDNVDHLKSSAFMNHLNKEINSLKMPDVYMHRSHDYGKQLQLDWCGDKVLALDDSGKIKLFPVLVLTFAASYYTFAIAVKNYSTEETIKAISKGLSFFNCLPKELVFDNAKSLVKTHKIGHEALINDTFLYYLRRLGIIPNAHSIKRANEKSAVENAVHLIQSKCLSRLKVRDLDSVNLRLLALVNQKINKNQFRGSDLKTRKFLFEQYEIPASRSLNRDLLNYIEHYDNLKVQSNYHVKINENYYSVPYKYVGSILCADIINGMINIYDDITLVAVHKPLSQKGAYSTLNEHMPLEHNFVSIQESIFKTANDILNHARSLSFEILTYCYALLNRDYDFEEMKKACLYIFKTYAALTNEKERKRFNMAIRMVIKREPLNKLNSYVLDKEIALLSIF